MSKLDASFSNGSFSRDPVRREDQGLGCVLMLLVGKGPEDPDGPNPESAAPPVVRYLKESREVTGVGLAFPSMESGGAQGVESSRKSPR